jgi:hypothetical protein
MKKLALLLPLLVACTIERKQNLAELRVKSDVTTAQCASGKLSDGTYVTKCTIKSEDGKVTNIVAAQGGDFPFQAWPFKSNVQIKDEHKAAEKAQAETQGAGSGAAAPVAPKPPTPKK